MGSATDTGISAVALLGGEATEGRLALLEVELRAGTEVPAHAAGREELVVYVAAGRVRLRRGGEWSELAAGEARVIKRGEPRALCAVEDSRLACLLAPAGNERLAAELASGQLDGDDGAALLTAAGVDVLPRPARAGPPEAPR